MPNSLLITVVAAITAILCVCISIIMKRNKTPFARIISMILFFAGLFSAWLIKLNYEAAAVSVYMPFYKVFEISEYGCFARNIEFSKTSSGGDDCSGWHINSDYSFLGEYRNDIAGWNKMDSCCNFYDMCCIITEGKNESNRGYGFGRHYEGWNIIYWRIG